MSGPFRLPPALPAHAMQSYRILSPQDTTVRAACEQVGCLAHHRGWETRVDESTPLGQFQASYIRRESGRTFTELKAEGGITVFRFEAGQRCFADHQTWPERFLVQGGDWRGNPRGDRRVHANAADWTEDFAEHQQKIADAVERG